MKDILIEILDFYKFKLEQDRCTPEEMRSAFNAINSDVACDVTIKDISEFYGQSESNVRNLIARKSNAKPRRVVLYDFQSIRNLIPKSWRKR